MYQALEIGETSSLPLGGGREQFNVKAINSSLARYFEYIHLGPDFACMGRVTSSTMRFLMFVFFQNENLKDDE
jgi:hypothetical protein